MTAPTLVEYKNLIKENPNDEKVEELFGYVSKLERLAVASASLKEAIEDAYATSGEYDLAYERLDEAFDEYELFLGNCRYLTN
jgi:hypothetical protein|tara:strand:- start:79 stop:327 length:249 start_codon:yes stop_codon:yes gene_type:complete